MSDNNDNQAFKLMQEAIAELQVGNLNSAEEKLEEAIRLNPEQSIFHNNLGVVLIQKGDYDKAEDSFAKAISLDSNSPDAYSNMGNLATFKNELDRATKFYEKAIELKPNFTDPYNNLGSIYQMQGKYDLALRSIKRAVEISPNNMLAVDNLGKLQKYLGDFNEAIFNFQRVLELNPNYIDVLNNLGDIYRMKEDEIRAEEYLLKAKEIDPNNYDTNRFLGLLYSQQNKPELEIQALEKAIDPLRPSLFLLGCLGACYLSNFEWNKLKNVKRNIEELLYQNADVEPIGPFNCQMITHDNFLLYKAATNWASQFITRSIHQPFTCIDYKHKKLKIGYISADFSKTSVSFLLNNMFSYHNRDDFEVFCFPTKQFKTKEYKTLLGYCDNVVNLEGLTAFEAATKINENEIDILVDLAGATGRENYSILAFTPAPVQCHFLGYTGTMGADYVQYFVTTEFVVPKSYKDFFKEKLVYLPDTEFSREGFGECEVVVTKEKYNLPHDKFIYVVHQAHYRVCEESFNAWMQILKKVPNSVLWIYCEHKHLQDKLLFSAQSQGVDIERIIFSSEFLLNNNWQVCLADLWLDPLHYTSGTGSFICAWGGIPMLTLAGNTPQSRHGAGYCMASGIKEQVVYSKDEYINKAIELGNSPIQVANLKKNLFNAKLNSKLFDCKRFVKNLEKAYILMHQDRFYPAGNFIEVEDNYDER